jgi:hypothetical protein
VTWLRLCGPSIGATSALVTFGFARNAAPVFRLWFLFLLPETPNTELLKDIGDFRRDPSRLILVEQLGCRAPARSFS